MDFIINPEFVRDLLRAIADYNIAQIKKALTYEIDAICFGDDWGQQRGRLTFHGGLSTQQTLPFGTPQEVRRETRKLISRGKNGGYILSPAHAVEGDVPLCNMLAFINEALNQPGFLGDSVSR